MNIAAGDMFESHRRPSSVTSQRADELSDEQLMTHLGGSGVEVAISELYDRYNRTVYGVGLKILGERSLAQELIQEPVLYLRRGAGGLADVDLLLHAPLI
jgi:RNA polymerase sigma-70 factor, ECF subfamily